MVLRHLRTSLSPIGPMRDWTEIPSLLGIWELQQRSAGMAKKGRKIREQPHLQCMRLFVCGLEARTLSRQHPIFQVGVRCVETTGSNFQHNEFGILYSNCPTVIHSDMS